MTLMLIQYKSTLSVYVELSMDAQLSKTFKSIMIWMLWLQSFRVRRPEGYSNKSCFTRRYRCNLLHLK